MVHIGPYWSISSDELRWMAMGHRHRTTGDFPASIYIIPKLVRQKTPEYPYQLPLSMNYNEYI
jgi:hypothetical protein